MVYCTRVFNNPGSIADFGATVQLAEAREALHIRHMPFTITTERQQAVLQTRSYDSVGIVAGSISCFLKQLASPRIVRC